MGTRGTTGFVIDGERKSSYQQYDSYPSGVGLTVLEFARRFASGGDDNFSIERVLTLARELRVVPESDNPTPEDLAAIGDVYHQNVSTGIDWYAYLRGTQGNPSSILDSGFATGTDSFMREEWDYLINFDTSVLTVIADGETIAHFPFSGLPTDEQFLALENI